MRVLILILFTLGLTGCRLIYPRQPWDPNTNKVTRRCQDYESFVCEDCKTIIRRGIIGRCRFPLEGCHEYTPYESIMYCQNCARLLDRCVVCGRRFR